MVTVSLEEMIKNAIKNLLNGKVDERVESFTDYKNQYAVLNPSVKVEVSLKKGVVAKIDISDFFTEELDNGKK